MGDKGWQERQGKKQATAADETETGGSKEAGQGPAKDSVAGSCRQRRGRDCSPSTPRGESWVTLAGDGPAGRRQSRSPPQSPVGRNHPSQCWLPHLREAQTAPLDSL